MKSLTIEYKPIKGLKYSRYLKCGFPQSFTELTAEQFIAVACLSKGAISDIRFIHMLTDLPVRILKKLSGFQVYNIMQLFTAFQNIKPFYHFIIKRIKYKSHAFYAPKPKLKGVTFGQFIYADTYYGDYISTGDPELLAKFVASLYLPSNTKFSESIPEASLPLVKQINQAELEAVSINYHLMREWLSAVYPLLFLKSLESEDENPEKNKKPKANKKANNGWLTILDNLIGDNLVDHDKYANLPVHNVFRFLSHRIKENSKSKR